MKNIKNIILTTVLGAVSASCSFLDLNPNIITSDNFYRNESEVRYGLAGVYGVINNEAFYGNYYSLMASNIDDLSYCNRPNVTTYLYFNRHDASTTEIYSIWTSVYQGIKNANAFMEATVNIGNEKMGTGEYKNGRYYNEARFLRAYYHFILAQTWGDVPLRTEAVKKYDEAPCAATPQYDILKWVIGEMEDCLKIYDKHPEFVDEDLANSPSRVCKSVMEGILARVCLFTAGESVDRGDDPALTYWEKALDYSGRVISGGKHKLNEDGYSQVFINMIEDKYDTEYRESMWEADFMGDRSSAENWTNGRIGDMLGIQNKGDKKFTEFNCNFANAFYNGSLKLWKLYWETDLVEGESAQDGRMIDERMQWNLPPYNYNGIDQAKDPAKPNDPGKRPYGSEDTGDPATYYCKTGIDKTPYIYNKLTTNDDILAGAGIRNAGKFRREIIYEGVKKSKSIYTTINYPILRYSDVLLMYAEAYNEVNHAPSQDAYNKVAAIRSRAKVSTLPYSGTYEGDYEAFRTLVRNERGRELCFESLRKYDLIRWGIFVESMKGYLTDAEDERCLHHNNNVLWMRLAGESVQEKHILLPIPNIELGVNKELKQNSLW